MLDKLFTDCDDCGRVHPPLFRHAKEWENRAATLTPREYEVFVLMAGAPSNHELTVTLFVTPHTVKAHLATVMRKLGLATRAQVVVASLMWNLQSCRSHPDRAGLAGYDVS